MGTYTTNYNLFMPSVGEQGWGELVNGNFTTIDATLKGLDTKINNVRSDLESDISNLQQVDTSYNTRITAVENKVGDGEYISNVTFPIRARLSTTNQGYGWISNSNGAYTSPVGFVFENANDTYTASFSNYAQFSLTVYPKKINLLTGAVTDLGAVSVKQGSTGSMTYTLKMIEAFICTNSTTNNAPSSFGNNLNITRPTIYINTV